MSGLEIIEEALQLWADNSHHPCELRDKALAECKKLRESVPEQYEMIKTFGVKTPIPMKSRLALVEDMAKALHKFIGEQS